MTTKNTEGMDMNLAHGTRSATTWPRHKAKSRKRKALRKTIAMWAQRERDARRSDGL